MTDFPKTLLITRWPADGRYAGAEVMRRVVRYIGTERVRWASFSSSQTREVRSHLGYFPARGIHWRFRGGFLEYLIKRADAKRALIEVVKWLGDFKPEVIWVVAELEALALSLSLSKKMGVPIHATFFDAPENSKLFLSQKYLIGFYIRELKKFVKQINSFDVVSEELLEHMVLAFGADKEKGVVLPPSINVEELRNLLPKRVDKRWAGDLRKIAFCGAMRIDKEQWDKFIATLEDLPFRFEFHLFTPPDLAPFVQDTTKTKFIFHSYVDDEYEIIRFLIDQDIDACYLGVWRDAKRALFSTTSLSSKLTTYLASGAPVIVDAPKNSAVVNLLKRYEFGVDVTNKNRLELIMSDLNIWKMVSKQVQAALLQHFDLHRNLKQIEKQFAGVK